MRRGDDPDAEEIKVDELSPEEAAALNEDEKDIPEDLLITEKINAKLFQFKLKRQGVPLSLWEVFSLFEHLNIKFEKLYFEP